MSDLESFLAAILKDPSDTGLQLICADWLEERGDSSLAFALRWMVARGKFPNVSPQKRVCRWMYRLKRTVPCAACSLPWIVHEAMSRWRYANKWKPRKGPTTPSHVQFFERYCKNYSGIYMLQTSSILEYPLLCLADALDVLKAELDLSGPMTAN